MKCDLARVYAADKRSSELASQMISTGFLFDVAAASEQRDKLYAIEQQARARVEDAVGRKLRTTATGGISAKDLHTALFDEMNVLRIRKKGAKSLNPSLDINAMRVYASSHREAVRKFAIAELERRRARKLRVTYIENIIKKLANGRIHYTWKTTGTVSGRWSSGLQQLPRKTNDPTVVWRETPTGKKYVSGGIRSLYIAPPGYKIVSFDKCQLEFRVAAAISGDPAMISNCTTGDIHAANAAMVWGDEFVGGSDVRKYTLRQLAKNFGFAICYLAEALTVYANIIANGETTELRVIEAAIRQLRARFKEYFRWQNARLMEITRTGYAYSPLLGRRRYLSHTPRATEAANYHVQSGAADVVNEILPTINDELQCREIDAKIVAMVHDSCSAEVRESHVEKYTELVQEINAKPVLFPDSGVTATFPIDISVGDRWS